MNTFTSYANPRRAWLFLAAALSLVLSACGDGSPKMELPQVKQGNNLTLVAKEVIDDKERVYYQCTTESYGCPGGAAKYEVTATEGQKLVLVRAQVYNRSARSVKLQVGTDGYILLDKDGKEYKSLDPFDEGRRRLIQTIPSKEVPLSFIWGPFELLESYSIEAWTVFDVPKDVEPWQLRWNPVETMFVPFYGIGPPPEESASPKGFMEWLKSPVAWGIAAGAVALVAAAGGFLVVRRRRAVGVR